MKKKVIKLIAIICVILCSIAIVTTSNAVTAEDVAKFSGSDGGTGAEPIRTIISMILDVVRLVGAAVAVIMLMTIAAKYMIASSGDRADIKKYALNYVIGAVILFAASGILTMIRDAITK